MTEVELARQVVAFLEREGFEVYQEVQLEFGGRTADIVALDSNRRVMIVEVKRTLGLSVMEQADGWTRRNLAHWVCVAAPHSNARSRLFADQICMDYGWGLIEVGQDASRMTSPPRFRRRAEASRVLDALTPEHQTYAEAGNADGRRWTPFQATCAAMRDFVRRRPGSTMREVVGGIRHHYATDASAKGCIMKWLRDGVIKDLRLDDSRRPFRLFLADEQQEASA